MRNGRPETAVRTEVLEMGCCRFCSGAVRQKRNSTHKPRTVFRLENGRITPVRYMRPRYYCARCKIEMLPEMGWAVPNTKFDREILILLALLHHDRGMSYRGISALFSESFGIPLAPATVYNSIKIVEGLSRGYGPSTFAGQS